MHAEVQRYAHLGVLRLALRRARLELLLETSHLVSGETAAEAGDWAWAWAWVWAWGWGRGWGTGSPPDYRPLHATPPYLRLGELELVPEIVELRRVLALLLRVLGQPCDLALELRAPAAGLTHLAPQVHLACHGLLEQRLKGLGLL